MSPPTQGEFVRVAIRRRPSMGGDGEGVVQVGWTKLKNIALAPENAVWGAE